MDIKERIQKAKERLEAAKNAKTKAETQLEAAQEQCDKVVEEMKQLGITPDTIEAEITRLSESVEENLKNVESNIPEVQGVAYGTYVFFYPSRAVKLWYCEGFKHLAD